MENRFEDAKFGRSVTFVTEDLTGIYNMWTVQFKFNAVPVKTLRDTGLSNAEIAREFGQFMEREFLAAVERHGEAKRREWDEGEKVTEQCEGGGTMTRLKDEKQPVYQPVKGEFEVIG